MSSLPKSFYYMYLLVVLTNTLQVPVQVSQSLECSTKSNLFLLNSFAVNDPTVSSKS